MTMYVFCFKQKTAYEMRISDWSSDVCSSDLNALGLATLASIPDARTLPGYRKSGLPAPPAELLLKRPQSTYAEAFRTLRTSIQFAEAATIGRASCRERGRQYR